MNRIIPGSYITKGVHEGQNVLPRPKEGMYDRPKEQEAGKIYSAKAF